jgi:hypothetical protein
MSNFYIELWRPEATTGSIASSTSLMALLSTPPLPTFIYIFPIRNRKRALEKVPGHDNFRPENSKLLQE